MRAALRRALQGLPDDARLLVGYSGGRDSTVLLDALVQLRGAPCVVAWPVHHGLQPAADRGLAFCEAEAARLGVRFGATRVPARPARGGNIEAWARSVRYRALWRAVAETDAVALLTAHHADDQVETVLMRLARGSGVAALGGMLPCERHPGGWLMRPLLDVGGVQLQAWAQARGLNWVEDPMNADPSFLRAALRHRIVPALAAAAPGLRANVLRSAQLLREAGATLNELGERDWRAAAAADDARSIDRRVLAALPQGRRNQAVRAWFRALRIAMPTQARLSQWVAQMLCGASPSAAMVVEGWRFRRYRDRVAVEAADSRDWSREPGPALALHWDGQGDIALDGWGGRLQVIAHRAHGGVAASRLATGPLQVRAPLAGLRLRPRAGAASRTLKNLFQEAGVPPWLRGGMPAVFVAGQLVYVGGLGMDCSQAGPVGSDNVRLHWRPDMPGDPRGAFGEGSATV
ncbi:MAG: tRNA lysidine(34) synthetase TilS [Burkholderiaceae bacterium]|nr:tRNA lysidine(34) synthetase TilS [Burkholderiaceae bacterium]